MRCCAASGMSDACLSDWSGGRAPWLGDPDGADLPTADPDFRRLPPPGTADADDMLCRLYAALDTWAVWRYVYLRNAMCIEFDELL